MINFRVLGNLEVWNAGLPLQPLRPRQQKFLARLLLNPQTLVSVGTLAEALWDGDAPASAERQVQNTASQLRQRLAAATGPAAKNIIWTAHASYSIKIGKDQIDLYQFRNTVSQAAIKRNEGYEPGAIIKTLRQALGLWRASAFSGVDSRVIREHASLLDEERAAAWEDCMSLEVQRGATTTVIPELGALVAEYPFREKLTGLQMVAFYRSGRQSDALRLFQKTRAKLSDELGIDPGPELLQLHQQILQNDPALLTSAMTESMTVARQDNVADFNDRIPHQIPPSDGHFTGRQEELETVVRYCGQAQVIAITGLAGIGKTSLAVELSQRIVDRFPDGQLFLDLGGSDTVISRSVSDVLIYLLEGLNTSASDIPQTLEKKIALYRSITANKRLLILLDNVANAEQVIPTIPASSGSQLIVTSRDMKAALHTHVTVKTLILDGLNRSVARNLLMNAAGSESTHASPALERLLDLCGGLPLALRILAARLLSESALSVVQLDASLNLNSEPLDGFVLSGYSRNVRSVLADAYSTLTSAQAMLLKAISIHPGNRVRRSTVAVVAALPLEDAAAVVDGLVALHLVVHCGDEYLSMHDLVRSYAAERFAEAPIARDAAVSRLLEWFLTLAAQANNLLRPDRNAFRNPQLVIDTSIQPFVEYVDVINFFNAERDNIAPLMLMAVRYRIEVAIELMYYMHSYFIRTGFPKSIIDAWRECEQRSIQIGDAQLLAHMHHALGGALAVTNEPEEAFRSLSRSAQLYEQTGDLAGAAGARLGIGFGLDTQGEWRKALKETDYALDLARRAGNVTLEVHALNNSADMLGSLGEYDAALGRLEIGRRLAHVRGLHHHEAAILSSVGALLFKQHQYTRSLEFLHDGLRLMRISGFRTAEAETLGLIGQVTRETGDVIGAAEWFGKAEILYRQNDDSIGAKSMARSISDLVNHPH